MIHSRYHWQEEKVMGNYTEATTLKNIKVNLKPYLNKERKTHKEMNPGKTQEHLLQNFPNHFSIPGDTRIKQFTGVHLFLE